jgi:putative ABC transport system permease protein
MPLWKIAWRSIQRRALASTLTAVSMALGVMLVVAVLLIHGVIAESFRNNSSLGYSMIIGAKGGRLQLVLNTVYYLSQPVENIPFEFYQEFLDARERGAGRDGEYHKYVEAVVPVCLGDYYLNYRVVGTTPEMFEFVYDAEEGKRYEFASGRNMQLNSAQFGYWEAVLGARVARETGLKVGDTIRPAHGSPEGHAHDEFHVVGILKPSGTPNDRAVFVSIEGFNRLPDHLRTDGSKEVTALLVRTVNPIVTAGLRTTINEGLQAQAVLPIQEIYGLFALIVKPVQSLLLVISGMICVVSGVSILVSIYNSMSDRRHEIAVMRSLGAGRATVMAVVLLESVMLALGGGLLGWTAGHALIGLASTKIEDQTGVSLSPLDLAPPVDLGYWSDSWQGFRISSELLLVPSLIGLAIVVGFLPALAAYRTDVAKALSSSP